MHACFCVRLVKTDLSEIPPLIPPVSVRQTIYLNIKLPKATSEIVAVIFHAQFFAHIGKLGRPVTTLFVHTNAASVGKSKFSPMKNCTCKNINAQA